MALDNSVVFIFADGDKAACAPALAAFFGDAADAQEANVALCPLGVDPDNATATAWGGAVWFDGAMANALKDWQTGTLPTPAAPWSGYGLDDASALAAGEKLKVQVMVGGGEGAPTINFASLLASLGLQQVQYPF